MDGAALARFATPFRRTAGLASRHRAFTIVLGLALVVHVLAYIAFHPALFFPDSWTYLSLAWGPERGHSFVGINFSRPSGYPMFLVVASWLTGHHAAPIAAIQQVFGLIAGVLMYAVLIRLNVNRWIAIVAAALVMFDAYLLTLAQTILGDTLAMLLILAAAAAVALLPSNVARWGAWPAIALALLAGVVLGYSVTIRTASLFAVPFLIIYALWSRKGWLVVGALTLGFLAPTLGYLQWHKDKTGTFSFTQIDGWFLYARIGEIGQCGTAKIPASARPICPFMVHPPYGANIHLWGGGASPATQAFHVGPQDGNAQVNTTLKKFAIAIIRDRPLRYARMVGHDVVRYFEPGVYGISGTDDVLQADHQPNNPESIRASAFAAWAPSYDTKVNLPRGVVDTYAKWLHTPRWLLGITVLLSGLLLTASILLRRRFDLAHRREAFLFLGAGVGLVVGATATSEFVLRYLMPAVPLLWVGVAIVLADVLALRRAGWRGLSAPVDEQQQ
jgi:Dolichyl-phosphate-mannose-protein mannosyltransferase